MATQERLCVRCKKPFDKDEVKVDLPQLCLSCRQSNLSPYQKNKLCTLWIAYSGNVPMTEENKSVPFPACDHPKLWAALWECWPPPAATTSNFSLRN